MLKKVIAITLVFLIGFSVAGYAANNPGEKLGRGVTNILTSWLEVPTQIYVVSRDHDPLTGLIFGPIKGSIYSVLRVVTGTYDTVSFPIPTDPLMEPEFIFEEWK